MLQALFHLIFGSGPEKRKRSGKKSKHGRKPDDAENVSFRHTTPTERARMHMLRREGFSVHAIANRLHRSSRTVHTILTERGTRELPPRYNESLRGLPSLKLKRMHIGSITKVGISLPQTFLNGMADPALIQRHATEMEGLGYDSLWAQHGVFTEVLEPFTLLSFAAAATRRVTLGLSVLVLPLWHPLHVAKLGASVDLLSGGRFILGVGIGGHESRYPAFGLSPEHRVTRFVQSVELIKRLWTEDSVGFSGSSWEVDGVSLRPRPAQRPRPPIWFGGRSEPALRRAARLADGFMGRGSASLADFQPLLASLRRYLAEAGRDPASFPISKRVYVAVDDDRARAERHIAEFFQHQYGSAEIGLQVSVYGSEDQVAEQLAALAGLGLDLVVFNTIYDHVEQAERLALRVLPQLR